MRIFNMQTNKFDFLIFGVKSKLLVSRKLIFSFWADNFKFSMKIKKGHFSHKIIENGLELDGMER